MSQMQRTNIRMIKSTIREQLTSKFFLMEGRFRKEL